MKKNDKHLIFLPDFDPWGPWRQLERQLQTRAEIEGPVRVVSLARQDQLPNSKQQERLERVEFEHLPLNSISIGNYRKLRQQILDWAPDFVWNWGGAPLVRGACRELDVEFIEVQYGPKSIAEASGWSIPGRQPDRVLTPVLNQGDSGGRRFGERGNEKFLRLAPAALSGQVQRTTARENLRATIGAPHDAVVITTISPLRPESGLKAVCWGFDLLNCIRDDVYLLIVGSGSQRWQLERFCRTLDCRKKIRIMDRLGDEAVMGADVYWNSSTENFAEGALAAMTWEVPVVTVITEETAPLFRHQQTVLGVEPGSRDQFARWSKYLLERPLERGILIQQALELVELDYQAKMESDLFRSSHSAVSFGDR
ncbi:MAG: glycosyltransferase [Pirellulaceae bacterium]|nr:glycosyltransferase [Pirellulaceae bacterium]